MQGPMAGGRVLALAEGPVDLEDPSTPTVGVVRASAGGAVMEEDLPANCIDNNGRIMLIIDEPSASWTMASTIAQIINDSEGEGSETLASALDQRNISVTIPVNERDHPDAFISRVQRLPVKILPTEARVQINSRTGTIIITGDVEISPVVISHKGLSISITNPAPVPSARNPIIENKDLIEVSTEPPVDGNLQDLITALKQLQVPTEDRIDILKELYETGKLHAKLIIDE
jgi:flagellar P-ring protein precursor FlgI